MVEPSDAGRRRGGTIPAVKPWHVFVAGMMGMLCGGVIVWLLVRADVRSAVEPPRPRWWCGDRFCYRDRLCDKETRCELSRLAWCPVGGTEHHACKRDLAGCIDRAEGFEQCIGVE